MHNMTQNYTILTSCDLVFKHVLHSIDFHRPTWAKQGIFVVDSCRLVRIDSIGPMSRWCQKPNGGANAHKHI